MLEVVDGLHQSNPVVAPVMVLFEWLSIDVRILGNENNYFASF